MKKILMDDGYNLWEILKKINSYKVDSKFPSLKRTIKHFDFNDVYTDVLDFIEYNIDLTKELEKYFEDNIIKDSNDFAMREKAETSLKDKWNKNSNSNKQFREVCNDIFGIRIITGLDQEELECEIQDIPKTNTRYKMQMVNFYNTPKSTDDGYRGIHLYFRHNPKCYSIEIQFWTRRDWLLNKYTHEVIYKQRFIQKHILDYSLKLRNWLDKMPRNPKEIISYEDYLYTMLQSVYKEGE
ncbi:hypothetical protein [Acetivibrio straminisolvens]|nr:hypothetical protein [Acetivibrio straminisolvens]